ncbi:serine O-acetyltransferase [Sinorhizobium fredii]
MSAISSYMQRLWNRVRHKAPPCIPVKTKPLVDVAVDPLLDQFDGLLTRGVPDAYRIWRAAQEYLRRGDTESAVKCQNLNYLLHNSSIPNSVKFGEGVRFGYGGIGIVIHRDCEIRKGAMIGANVTLGGRSGGKIRLSTEGKRVGAPLIGDYAYLATGCKILGGIEIGSLSIVGANAVVTRDVPPLTIVAGAPAQKLGTITAQNCLRYKSMFIALRDVPNDKYVALIDNYRTAENTTI